MTRRRVPLQNLEIGALYERYGYYVQRRCLALLGNAADAEDVTQEVFMRVQRYQSSLTAPATLAWLYTIATRCCFDRGRRRAAEEPADPLGLAELDARYSGDARDGDRRAVALQLLHRLDDDGREIALLHHLEGLTQEEVAARTGYSRKTVGKKLAQFADALRRACQRAGLLTTEVQR
jgi:RNA polymerase sigma factor (sigma-70 family)